jgi:hypothetical protein
MLDWLVKRDIKPHIPVPDHVGRKDGTWSRADFEWDAENNQYICPSKPKCCTNADVRKITREEHEDVRQVARDIAKTKQYVVSMSSERRSRCCSPA